MYTALFESKTLRIVYDHQHDYLHLKWIGFSEGKEFRNLASEVLRAIATTESTRILSDNTSWRAIAPNDHGWAANTWFPIAEAQGVRKLATVLSNDLFNRIAERSIEGMADVNCMQIKNFQSAEEATAWLTGRESFPKC